MQHQIETRVEPTGTITLHNLPFHEGEKVLVVITPQPQSDENTAYPLRGLPVCYENPFDAVAEDDWGALQ